jgi:hypothetical protein
MFRLIRNLVRPYRKGLAVVLAGVLVETSMSLAAPWPLKVVLGNVVERNRLPHWLHEFLRSDLEGAGRAQIALLAGIGFVAIVPSGPWPLMSTLTPVKVWRRMWRMICGCARTERSAWGTGGKR